MNKKEAHALVLAISVAVLVCAQLVENVMAHWTSHDNITEDALNDEFTPEALKKMISANEGQDAGSNAADKKRHFDRGVGEGHGVAFKRGKDYILEELNLIKTKLSDTPSNDDVDTALQAFGRLLHTLQDLTSHSNFIKLSPTDQQKVLDAILDCSKEPPESLQLTSYLSRTDDIREKLRCDYRIDTPSHGKEGLDDDPNAVTTARQLTDWMDDQLEKQIGKDKIDLIRKWKPPAETKKWYLPWTWFMVRGAPDPRVPVLTTDGHMALSIAIPVAYQSGLPLFISTEGMFNESMLKQITELEPKFVVMLGENDSVLPLYKKHFDAAGIVNVFFGGDYQNMSVGLYKLFNYERVGQIPLICDPSHPILSKDAAPIYVSNVTSFLELFGEFRFRNMAVISNYGTVRTLAEVASHLYPEIVTHDVSQEISDVHTFIDLVRKSAQNGYVPAEVLQGLVDSYLRPVEHITIPKVVDAYPLSGSTAVPVTTKMEIAFSKAMNQTSTQRAVTISPSVNVEVSWFENVLILMPKKLDYETAYTVTINTTAEDLLGNHLTTPFQITFTTMSQLQSRVLELQLELEATRMELQEALLNLQDLTSNYEALEMNYAKTESELKSVRSSLENLTSNYDALQIDYVRTESELERVRTSFQNLTSNYEALEVDYAKADKELDSVKGQMGVLPWAILGSTIAAAAIGFGLSRLMMARPPRRPKPCGRRAPRWTCPGCGRNNGWARGTCPGCGVQRPAWTCRCHNFTNPAGTVRCQCMQH